MTCGASLPDAIAAAPRGGGVRRPFVKIYWRVQERRSGFYRRGDQEELEWRWRGKIKRRLEATCFWFSGGEKCLKVTCLSLRRWWDVSSSHFYYFEMHWSHTKAPPPPGCLGNAPGGLNGTAALIINLMEFYFIQISSFNLITYII